MASNGNDRGSFLAGFLVEGFWEPWQLFSCPQSGQELRSDLRRKERIFWMTRKSFIRRREPNPGPFLTRPTDGRMTEERGQPVGLGSASESKRCAEGCREKATGVIEEAKSEQRE